MSIKEKEFKPYISAKDFIPEFTLRAIIMGAIFSVIFGAVSCYLGLKIGLTVSASIPISVLAISIFKKLGKATILESNMVQTVGSAGESVAAGVITTIPALLFLPGGEDYFKYFQIFVLAFTGGMLGILFMVPLRRSLIVKEHKNLPYPEGTACADVLIAGEKGGNLAQKVYYGLGIAILYKLLMSILGFWKEVPSYIFSKTSVLPNATIKTEVGPELLGVGYIIGPKVGSVMLGGGLFSWIVLIPMITMLGDQLSVPFLPEKTKLIAQMSADEIWNRYIRYIGAGAVAFGGLITLIKSLPTIVSAFGDAVKDLRKKTKGDGEILRTEKEIPLIWVVLGSIGLVAFMVVIPNIPTNLLSALMIVVFGFFFVTVSSRIVGLIGSSANPVSGMTIATLMATCLIFIGMGWTGDYYQPIVLVVGSIVCIAAANAGATSQDLKTGYLVGATPFKQQIGLIIGVVVAVVTVGFTILLLQKNVGIAVVTEAHPNPLPGPQSVLMATVIKGLLSKDLPWGLVIAGMGISAIMELCGVNALLFALGTYLPLSTTSAIFVGGMVRKIAERKQPKTEAESEAGAGTLFSSGLIAGGALTGIIVAILVGTNSGTPGVSLADKLNMKIGEGMGPLGDLIAAAIFLLLCIVVYRFAISKNKSEVNQ
ncbi:OPT family oligopeptide transporter [Pedobacter sp. UBA4863]|uniref:OPT family oligopeptide transporter n=1 Tax=Pedobacter sp. UBA4863 TaxID=1947060 RepID=UPI0025DE11EA|nr:oligopeptide transporter, OPT family [Pedobacter sp. UBA4863]